MLLYVGYTELLLIVAVAALSLGLRRHPTRRWGRAALIVSVLAALTTPADIFSTLVVFAGLMLSLWIGARFMASPALR